MEEQRAPSHNNLLFSKGLRQIELNLSVPFLPSSRIPKRTNVACLYAFSTICSISPASSLISFTNPCPIVKSLGKVASTILSKSTRFSPDLKRYTRQIARRHCKPANTEEASFVLSNCTVMFMKAGHFSGKSWWRIFWRTGTSCDRIRGGEDARTGSNRSRNLSFSSSPIALFCGLSSLGLHPLVTRFFK
jgi:hypothetical protein